MNHGNSSPTYIPDPPTATPPSVPPNENLIPPDTMEVDYDYIESACGKYKLKSVSIGKGTAILFSNGIIGDFLYEGNKYQVVCDYGVAYINAANSFKGCLMGTRRISKLADEVLDEFKTEAGAKFGRSQDYLLFVMNSKLYCAK